MDKLDVLITVLIVTLMLVTGLLIKSFFSNDKEALAEQCLKRFGDKYEYRRTELGNVHVCLNKIEGDIKRF